jgi:uncharacterized protein DUF1329
MMKTFVLAVSALVISLTTALAATVKPGDVITPDNASAVQDLLSPGNFLLVKQGMKMKIVPTERLEWSPPYKSATEKYSTQVVLNDKGELANYVAGLPFPLLDPNDPQVATKVLWNVSLRPQYTDDVDARNVEVVSRRSDSPAAVPVEHFIIGHFAFYNSMGRTEVPPIPTDPEATGAHIRYRFGAFPFLEPAKIRGFGLVRERSADPSVDDNAWYYSPASRRLRRATATSLSDAMGPLAVGVSVGGGSGGQGSMTYASNLDPDSYFGFMAKIEDYDYKLIGLKPMLACVHAQNIPAKPCELDNGRSVCPEDWEMRQTYIVEASAKPKSWSQKIGGDEVIIPKRILYIDSEGWFITASDQYDREGKLWKTIATFNAYRDRPVPDARVAIYPFKRMFQTALVDEDVQDGFSTVVYMPGRETEERECWYINMGIVTKSFLDPHQLGLQAH